MRFTGTRRPETSRKRRRPSFTRARGSTLSTPSRARVAAKSIAVFCRSGSRSSRTTSAGSSAAHDGPAEEVDEGRPVEPGEVRAPRRLREAGDAFEGRVPGVGLEDLERGERREALQLDEPRNEASPSRTIAKSTWASDGIGSMPGASQRGGIACFIRARRPGAESCVDDLPRGLRERRVELGRQEDRRLGEAEPGRSPGAAHEVLGVPRREGGRERRVERGAVARMHGRGV